VCPFLSVDAGELQSLGLYDPTDEHAALRLELLRYLIDLGASAEDLTVYRDTPAPPPVPRAPSACDDHPLIPRARGGLASGRVMMRDGDVFGPVVNLAARAVKVAQPGEVLVTADLAETACLRTEPRGLHRLEGVTSDVELRRLIHS
jgi:hypothetical protein